MEHTDRMQGPGLQQRRKKARINGGPKRTGHIFLKVTDYFHKQTLKHEVHTREPGNSCEIEALCRQK